MYSAKVHSIENVILYEFNVKFRNQLNSLVRTDYVAIANRTDYPSQIFNAKTINRLGFVTRPLSKTAYLTTGMTNRAIGYRSPVVVFAPYT